ncbi:MAG: hypothetical protein KAS04_04600 [Candidatus Aenigmarchaeota archaeon]|nr:hypothetical protein [Candidatus Aenigmarchaeota archaeon]
METIYKLNQLKEAWEEYTTKKVMKVTKEGKQYIRRAGTKLENGVTSAEVVTYRAVMSFPRFLEEYYG